MINDRELYYLALLVNGWRRGYIRQSDVVGYCDELVKKYNEVPDFVISLSLGEFSQYGELPIELTFPEYEYGHLKFYLSKIIEYYKNDHDVLGIVTKLHDMWYEFRFPEIMKDFYQFSEAVQPHSDRVVPIDEMNIAVQRYLSHLSGKLG